MRFLHLRDLQDAPFFTVKLGIKILPTVVMFKNGVSVDRLVGFEQLGGRDDFSTAALEARLKAADVVSSSRKATAAEDDESDGGEDDRVLQHGIRKGFVTRSADDESSDFED